MFAGEQEEEHVLLASHKANALQHLWEETLSLRIALQKPLDLANQLPVVDLQELFSQEKKKKNGQNDEEDDEEDETEEGPQSLRKTLYHTTNQLLTLLEEQQQPQAQAPQKKKKVKEEEEEDEVLWSRIESCQNRLQSGWETTLNKWSARLHYGSEKAKAQLKVFNQSAWDQIEGTLSDERRLMERSRPSVEDSRRLDLSHELSHILPEDMNQENHHHLHGLFDGLYFHPRGLGGDEEEGNNSKKNKKRKVIDAEVYDDRPFYSLLLQTFITTTQHRNSGGNEGLRANDLAVLRAYKKKKANNVDRKASKGRRLRYTVHQKLQNFMFPISLATIMQQQYQVQDGGQGMAMTMDRDRLFASLFQ